MSPLAAAAPKRKNVTFKLTEIGKGAYTVGYPVRLSVMQSDYTAKYSISTKTPAVCDAGIIEGFTPAATVKAPGTCTVVISVSDTKTYAGSAEYSFQVPKKSQYFFVKMSSAYPPPTSPAYAPSPVNLSMGRSYSTYFRFSSLLARNEGTPLQVTSSDPSICTGELDYNGIGDDHAGRVVVTPVSAGNCTLTVSRPESAEYAATSITWDVRVMPDSEFRATLRACDATPIRVGATGAACFEAKAAPLGVTLRVAPGSEATCSVPDAGGKAVVGKAAGTCKLRLTLNQDTFAIYGPATGADQEITLSVPIVDAQP